jgi:hypothetical protein
MYVSPGGRRSGHCNYPPATEETGAMGREIESREGIGWQLKKLMKKV